MEIAVIVGVIAIVGVLIYFMVKLSKGSGYKDAIIEKDNVEKEIIEENRKKVWSNKDAVAKYTDSERAKLLKKFSRKP